MEITKYGDVGTKERHIKFGGIRSTLVDGQPCGVSEAEDCLDVLLLAKAINQSQFDACFQLCRDYKIGCLYKWKFVKSHLRRAGLSAEEAEEERERCRRDFNSAIRYNSEFIIIANLTHIVLGQVGVRIPAPWKIQQLSDRLIKYYCISGRNEIVSKSST